MFDLHAQRSRKIVRRTTHRVVGRSPSLKSNRVVHWESQLERDMIRLLEFDPAVLSYREQPEPLMYYEGGRKRKYTPDFIAEMISGVTMFEVKPSDQANTSPLRERLLAFKKKYAEQGISYLVMTDREIRKEPRLSNVIKLLRYQREVVSAENRAIIFDAVSSGAQTLGGLQLYVHKQGVHISQIYALISQGNLAIDLNQPINDPDAPIYLRSAS